jgi:hypothetical protein
MLWPSVPVLSLLAPALLLLQTALDDTISKVVAQVIQPKAAIGARVTIQNRLNQQHEQNQ